MDWDGVIEKNREALKRIVVVLFGMAGLGAPFTSPLWGGPASLKATLGWGALCGGDRPTRLGLQPRHPPQGEGWSLCRGHGVGNPSPQGGAR